MIVEFDYGKFEYKKEDHSNYFPIIRGRFSLKEKPEFWKDFQKEFVFFDFTQIEVFIGELRRKHSDFEKIICLGPYYPWTQYQSDKMSLGDFEWPIFSDILLNSKTGKLVKRFEKARKEQLKILGNLFFHTLNQDEFNSCKIISVPAKPSYSFNSVDYIANEFPYEKIKGFYRESDEENSPYFYDGSDNRSIINQDIIIIDDNLKDGTTKQKIYNLLKDQGARKIYVFTLGYTYHFSGYY